MNEISLADTKRVGHWGYTRFMSISLEIGSYTNLNMATNSSNILLNKYGLLTLNGYAKDTVELGPDETLGLWLIADRLWLANDKNQTIFAGSKTIFALESAFLMKAFSDGKHLFQWVFQKGDKVYSAHSQALRILFTTLRPFIEDNLGVGQTLLENNDSHTRRD